MPQLLLIFFSLAPSIIWLLFFLRKDAHPEPNSQIIKIFFLGTIAGGLAYFLETKFRNFLSLILFLVQLNQPISLYLYYLLQILWFFIGVGFIEEFLKYLVVKVEILRDPEFDEPVDALLYMIIAALGFAALDNFLHLREPDMLLAYKTYGYEYLVISSSARFIGATFLHALCSGVVGYFLALSILNVKSRIKLIGIGLVISASLHGLYDFSIMKLPERLSYIIPSIILITLAILVLISFRKLKKIKSICRM